MITFTIERPKEVAFNIPNIDLGADAYDRGYEEGEKVGYTNGYEIGAKEGYEVGYNKGKAEGNVLLYAKTLPSYAVAAFPDGYELELNIPNFVPPSTGSFGNWQDVTGLRRLKLVSSATVPALNCTTLMNASSIEEFDVSEFPRNFKNMASTFLHCRFLRRIVGELDLTEAAFNGYEFYNCTALEEIRIKSGTIKKSIAFAQSDKLSAASIQSIIDGLADLTGATAQKLGIHSDVLFRLTETQYNAITAKNWTL